MKYIRSLSRWSTTSLGILSLLSALSIQPVFARVGLEDYPQSELGEFWEKVAYYARVEANLIYCGHTMRFQSLAIDAARECVRDSTLEVVRNVFRQRLEAQLASQRSKQPEPEKVCPKWNEQHAASAIRDLDNALAFIRQQCANCVICHIP